MMILVENNQDKFNNLNFILLEENLNFFLLISFSAITNLF
ncbi:hypothetical protein PRO82_001770 [Candidatus Protochlamydia amoebophila]|nr:hypothetical protein [Candidatus Protochlamydia amoebophila]